MRFTALLATAAISKLVSAQAPTSEAAEAAISDPTEECTPYGYAPVTALQQVNGIPPIWEIANLSTADANTVALFNALNGSIPNWPPAGTPQGNFSGVSYNGVEDPHCWWTWKQCTVPKIAELKPDITRCPEPNTWGLAFDDGPNCSHNAFYDYLQSINQKATLFYIGSNVADWPLQAQRGIDDGHEVCAHTWSHRYMTSLTNEEAFAELYYSKKIIKDILGVTVQCWRPPYGDVDDRIRYIAQALGMATVVWHDNTFDYTVSETNVTYVENNYKAIFAKQSAGDYNDAGTIVLTHELTNETMSLAEMFLPQIQSQFSHAAPIAVCMNNTNPYLEQDLATYPNFDQWAAGTRSISVASATAVTTGTVSIPLQTTQSGSFFASLAYETASAATVGATGAVTGSGANAGATAAQAGAVSTTGSGTFATGSSQTTTATVHGAASRMTAPNGLSNGAMGGLLVTIAGLIAGAILL